MFLKLFFLFSTYFYAVTASNSSSLYDRGPVVFPKTVSNNPPTSNGTKSSKDDRGPVVFPKTEPANTNTPPSSCNDTLKCGDNEVLDDCPSKCPSDFCPTGEGQNKKCPKPNPCPAPACKCRMNWRRAKNDKCIPTEECPPFNCTRPNEVYHPCPPLCPTDSCSQASPTGTCPPLFGSIGIVLECKPTCRCKKGYWRNNNKTCIPFEEC